MATGFSGKIKGYWRNDADNATLHFGYKDFLTFNADSITDNPITRIAPKLQVYFENTSGVDKTMNITVRVYGSVN